MTERLSRGPVQITELSLVAINDALREVQDRIDELFGLRGGFDVHSDLTIDRVKHGTDAVKYTDTNSEVLHGMGNV